MCMPFASKTARHHEQWFMNCLVRQFCLFTEISSIDNNKQTPSHTYLSSNPSKGWDQTIWLPLNHFDTITQRFLLLSNIHQCRRKV